MVISILTFNVWFSEYYRNERIKEIIRIIMENKPTIICLQEVINETLSIILENDFIKKNYETSIKELNRVYGELILYSKKTKVNISNIHRFSLTRMERHINHIELELGSKKLNIITAHLESDFKYEWIKLNQLEEMLLNFTKNKNVIYAGDTNMSNKVEKEYNNLLEKYSYKDAWIEMNKKIKYDELKYTYDGKMNNNIKGRYRNRLDRVIYKLADFGFCEFELVGKEERVKTLKGDICPSDHFGIIFTINGVN
tara:strand:- start:1703 stop:2464 length:762 start_codon:yes stop_codon:yes gene_type:complete